MSKCSMFSLRIVTCCCWFVRTATRSKYLCGHDERHWFVAGIPESAPVGTVRQAKEALQPREVQNAVARRHVSGKARNRRKNAAFVRQGEWFFLPVADMTVDESLVLTNEPLRRGNGGKPHWAEFVTVLAARPFTFALGIPTA